jgi:hypothetical protein
MVHSALNSKRRPLLGKSKGKIPGGKNLARDAPIPSNVSEYVESVGAEGAFPE